MATGSLVAAKERISCFMIGAIVAKNTSLALEAIYDRKQEEARTRIANAINELETNQTPCLTEDYKENVLEDLHEAYDKVKKQDFDGAEIRLRTMLTSYPLDNL